ncbi:MAG TPA: divergent polysaccharide deacetylase family protein [Xanthobacteraceae bacterium]|nr:divergent polysaccharide deacetylase family protein [Xanthobacteraceae bacterium]
MAFDDLNAPLGQKPRKKRLVLPIAVPHLIAAALGLFVAVYVGWAIVVRDPLGGEPVAVVTVRPDPTKPGNASKAIGANRYDGPPAAVGPQPGSLSGSGAAPEGERKPAPGMQTITIIDGTSGKRHQVEIPAAPQVQAGAPVDQRLLEPSRHGAIPRLGADGARPADAYARIASAPDPDKPRIAIVIGGLGVSASVTAEAFAKLPGPVTLAFSPYAPDAAQLAARARANGHEVLLQVPMEPFDYPDNDPGPQTLLTSLLADQNLDRLHWAMSRFQGYVGVVNLMGSRFTASERALAPILNEVTRRGLIYVDDGGSPRSLASQIAGANNLPFAKAEVVLDAVPTPASIDRALTRLEALARERGVVVGIASAAPAIIERIAQWAKAAEARGIVLVPITAAAIKPKAS